MTKLTLRVQALTALAIFGGLAGACGNSDDDDSDSSDAGTGGSLVSPGVGGTPVVMPPPTGGMTGASGGSPGGGACDGLASVGGDVPLVDDFEHADSASINEVDGRVGSWFTSNDGTAGHVQLPEGDAFPTASVGVGSSYGFASSGSGFETWGANFGVSLNDMGGNGCAYDAQAFDGINVQIFANGAQTINVGVPIPDIIPTSRGGTCSGEGCDDTHVKAVTLVDGWNDVTILWSELAQNATWTHDNKYPFDSANIAQITFGVTANVDYDVVIDDLTFLGGNSGGGGQGGSN